MHIETEIQIKSNTGKIEKLKIEAFYRPEDLLKYEPEIIKFTLVAVLRDGKYYEGSRQLTWQFMFNETYPIYEEFERVLQNAIAAKFLTQKIQG